MVSRRRPSRALIATAVLAAALVAGACGGDTTKDELREALSSSSWSELTSARLDAELVVTGIPQADLRAGIKGTFEGDTLDLTGTATGRVEGSGRFDLSGRLVAAGGRAYIAGEGGPFYDVGRDLLGLMFPEVEGPADLTSFAEACRLNLEQSGIDPGACENLNPDEWLGEVAEEGEVRIGDDPAVRYTAELDVGRIAGDFYDVFEEAGPMAVELGDRDAFVEQARNVVTEASIDVARGAEDGIPRRFAFELGISFLGQEIGISYVTELTEVNEPHPVTPPEGALPVERLRPEVPAMLRPLFDCVLEAGTPQELNVCLESLPGLSFGDDPPQSV